MTDFHTRDVKKTDLEAVARIHKASFPDRALTQLGIGTIRRYYSWLLSGFSTSHPICAETITGDLAGFCFAGHYGGSFIGFLRRNKGYLFLSLIIRPWLLFHQTVRAQFIVAINSMTKRMRVRRPSTPVPYPQKEYRQKPTRKRSWGILSIAVDPAYQHQGVGALLMAAVENDAIAKGYSKLHLTVHPENATAVRFYEGLGWERASTSVRWEGLMEKQIE